MDLLRRIVGKSNVIPEFAPFSDTPLSSVQPPSATDAPPDHAPAAGSTSAPHHAPSNASLRAFDIRASFPGGRIFLVDVSIANPACKKMVEKYRSHCTPGAAARAHQDMKARNYGEEVRALGLDRSCLISFAVEATGRLGPMASRFLNSTLKKVSAINPDTLASSVRFFLRRMRYLLASFNAQLIAAFSKSSQELWQPASLLYQYHRSSLSGLDSGIGIVDKNLSVYDDLEDDDPELHWTSYLPQSSKTQVLSHGAPTDDNIDENLKGVSELPAEQEVVEVTTA